MQPLALLDGGLLPLALLDGGLLQPLALIQGEQPARRLSAKLVQLCLAVLSSGLRAQEAQTKAEAASSSATKAVAMAVASEGAWAKAEAVAVASEGAWAKAKAVAVASEGAVAKAEAVATRGSAWCTETEVRVRVRGVRRRGCRNPSPPSPTASWSSGLLKSPRPSAGAVLEFRGAQADARTARQPMVVLECRHCQTHIHDEPGMPLFQLLTRPRAWLQQFALLPTKVREYELLQLLT